MRHLFAAALLAFAAAAPASAQMIDRKVMSLAQAKSIAAAAMAEAVKNNWTVVVAIVDEGGGLMYLERRDGTQLASADIAVGKAKAALLFKRPSKALEDGIAGGRPGMMTLNREVVMIEGGLPLVHMGQVVGAIGVSGVTSPQDGVVAKAGAETLK